MYGTMMRSINAVTGELAVCITYIFWLYTRLAVCIVSVLIECTYRNYSVPDAQAYILYKACVQHTQQCISKVK